MSHLEKAAPPYILRRLDPGVEEVARATRASVLASVKTMKRLLGQCSIASLFLKDNFQGIEEKEIFLSNWQLWIEERTKKFFSLTM